MNDNEISCHPVSLADFDIGFFTILHQELLRCPAPRDFKVLPLASLGSTRKALESGQSIAIWVLIHFQRNPKSLVWQLTKITKIAVVRKNLSKHFLRMYLNPWIIEVCQKVLSDPSESMAGPARVCSCGIVCTSVRYHKFAKRAVAAPVDDEAWGYTIQGYPRDILYYPNPISWWDRHDRKSPSQK